MNRYVNAIAGRLSLPAKRTDAQSAIEVELETYARQSGNAIVKPFLLVIARDTIHTSALMALIQSDAFFEGRYKERVSRSIPAVRVPPRTKWWNACCALKMPTSRPRS